MSSCIHTHVYAPETNVSKYTLNLHESTRTIVESSHTHYTLAYWLHPAVLLCLGLA